MTSFRRDILSSQASSCQ